MPGPACAQALFEMRRVETIVLKDQKILTGGTNGKPIMPVPNCAFQSPNQRAAEIP
jgi:hypothetical protein